MSCNVYVWTANDLPLIHNPPRPLPVQTALLPHPSLSPFLPLFQADDRSTSSSRQARPSIDSSSRSAYPPSFEGSRFAPGEPIAFFSLNRRQMVDPRTSWFLANLVLVKSFSFALSV